MFEVILMGILTGIIVAMPFGPVGMLCVKKSFLDGFRTSFMTSVGAVTADFIYGLIIVFGLSFITNLIEINQELLKLIGGIFLIMIGLKIYFENINRPINKFKKFKRDYLTGLSLAIINPVTLFLFAFIFVSFGYKSFLGEQGGNFIYLAGYLIGLFIMWSSVSFLPWLYKRRYGGKYLTKFQRIAGTFIFICGDIMVLDFILDFWSKI